MNVIERSITKFLNPSKCSYYYMFQKCAKPKYSTKCDGLLSDVNVIDLTRVVAGPFCTMTLGDLGANIIKVESLDGDESRKWGPPFIKGSNDSVYFLAINRNKKSICIDFKTLEGKFLDFIF